MPHKMVCIKSLKLLKRRCETTDLFSSGYASIIDVLFRNKANMSAEDLNLNKPLHYAASNGNLDVKNILKNYLFK